MLMQDLRNGSGLHRVQQVDPEMPDGSRAAPACRWTRTQPRSDHLASPLPSSKRLAAAASTCSRFRSIDRWFVLRNRSVSVRFAVKNEGRVVRDDHLGVEVAGTGGRLHDLDTCLEPGGDGVRVVLIWSQVDANVDVRCLGGNTLNEVEQPRVVRRVYTQGTASQSRRLERLTALSMAAHSGLPVPSGAPGQAFEIISAMWLHVRPGRFPADRHSVPAELNGGSRFRRRRGSDRQDQ